MTLQTYEGSGDTVHPSVARIPGGLNGFEYWMGNTPWTSNDTEQPHLYVSHDGITWQWPPGVTNPLDIAMGSVYNSDTELLWDGERLHLLWRRVNGDMAGFLVRSSSDGVTWSPTRRVFADTYELSPCLWWDGTQVHMWTVSMNHRGVGEIWDSAFGRWRHIILHRTAPTIDGPWSSSPTPCVIPQDESIRHDPWHMGVTRHNGVWHALIGLGELGWGGGGPQAVLASSSDGVNWRVGDGAALRVEPGTWQNSNIYRPSLRVEAGRVRVWYSGRSSAGQNRTAYCELPPSALLTPPV